MSIGKILRKARIEAKLSQAQVAQLVGVSRESVTFWEGRGKGAAIPGARNFYKVCEVLGLNAEALLQIARGSEKAHKIKRNSPLVLPLGTCIRIPVLDYGVITRGKAELMKTFEELSELNYKFINYPFDDVSLTKRNNLFALDVTNEAMIALTTRERSYYPGDTVICDGDKTPKSGDIVAAGVPDRPLGLLRKFIEDGGAFYLQALNPEYPRIPVTEQTEIIGVVVTHLSKSPQHNS